MKLEKHKRAADTTIVSARVSVADINVLKRLDINVSAVIQDAIRLAAEQVKKKKE
jgi:post-segregation antitoxin (ccd killing protein)